MRLFFSKRELKLRRKKTIAAIICAVLVLGIYWILTQPQKAALEAPIIIIEPVVKNGVEMYGEYVGRIRAQQFVEVRAQMESYLESMLSAEGTYVNRNQVLFIINQDQYRVKAGKARAQLEKDKAQALKVEHDSRHIRPLFGQNAASRLDLDSVEATYESAAVTIAMSETDLAQAELELGYITVRSPLSGHISERNVNLGTLVGSRGKSLLAAIVKSDTVLVDFSMTAFDYLKSEERDTNLGRQDFICSWQPNITITLADNAAYPSKGCVDFVEPQVDPQTGTFSVRTEIPNPKQVLLSRQFTRVKLLLDACEGALAVPMKVITIEKGGARIYAMRRDSAVGKCFIELGPEVGDNVVVEKGLVEGEMIVIEESHKLTPGMKIRVSQPDVEAQDSITTTENEVAGAKENVTGTKDNAKGE